MQSMLLNAEEVDLIKHLRLLTSTQKTAIICAVYELSAQRDTKVIQTFSHNVIPLPRRA